MVYCSMLCADDAKLLICDFMSMFWTDLLRSPREEGPDYSSSDGWLSSVFDSAYSRDPCIMS